jgi:signal transduction histidine kinase
MTWWRNRDTRDLLFGAIAGGAMIAESLATVNNRGPWWGNVAGYGALGVLVALRRRRTLTVCLVAYVLACVLTVTVTPVSQLSSVIFVVAFLTYTAGHELDLAHALVALAGVVVTVFVVDAIGPNPESATDGFFPCAVFAIAWGVGRALRNHLMLTRELAITNEQLELQREERARDAVADERRRIARELHDVVAHSVSVMVVQSGAARRTLSRDAERAAEALAAAEESGRTALVELRRMLGLMTDEKADTQRSPQPTLKQLDTLIERARHAGLDVELQEEGERFPLAAGADLAAYRVVQEALTNTLKHAGPTRATVALHWKPDALDIEIADAGTQDASAQTLGGAGQGLVGMRERLELYGGHVDARPEDDGGFVVQASIPRDTVVAA